MELTVTWEGVAMFIASITTLIGAWRSIVTLKRDILKNIKNFICAEVDLKLKPYVDCQADVLRYSITRAHAQHTKDGYVDKYSLQALEYLYKDYHSLSGNGFVDTLMEELRNMPAQAVHVRRKTDQE
jgi:hypothetical protein